MFMKSTLAMGPNRAKSKSSRASASLAAAGGRVAPGGVRLGLAGGENGGGASP